jgi:hypothetical protein
MFQVGKSKQLHGILLTEKDEHREKRIGFGNADYLTKEFFSWMEF